jgi:hypothetical protein
MYAAISKEKLALLKLLVDKHEQMSKYGRQQEKYQRRNEEEQISRLANLTKWQEQYSQQVYDLGILHQHLQDWSARQEEATLSAVNKTVEAVIPSAISYLTLMLSRIDTELQAVIDRHTDLQQDRVSKETTYLALALQEIHERAEDKLSTLFLEADSTSLLLQAHAQQLEAAHIHSTHLATGIDGLQSDVFQLHTMMEQNVDRLKGFEEDTEEAVKVILGAVTLLNTTSHSRPIADQSWTEILVAGWHDWSEGNNGRLLLFIQRCYRYMMNFFESSLRE